MRSRLTTRDGHREGERNDVVILVSGPVTGGRKVFDDGTLYLAGDPALLVLGRPSTLAHWRSEGRGPAFIKLGSRVAYRGSDLNAWLDTRTIRPADGQQAGAC